MFMLYSENKGGGIHFAGSVKLLRFISRICVYNTTIYSNFMKYLGDNDNMKMYYSYFTSDIAIKRHFMYKGIGGGELKNKLVLYFLIELRCFHMFPETPFF